MSKRYKKLSKHKGIYKDLVNGRYQARKKIQGKQFAETFDTVREALNWRHSFNGQRNPKVESVSTSTLGQVWQRMQDLHFPSLELSTQRIWQRRWDHLSTLQNYHMEDITPTVINKWIENKKKWFLSGEY